MEYLLIALATCISTVLVYFVVQKAKRSSEVVKVKVSQSRTYDLLAPFVIPIDSRRYVKRQSINHLEKTQIRILMTEDKAYWIKDNSFYSADMANGIIIEESTKTVDIMGMDEVELEKMIFIIDTLTEGKANDYRDSRDS